MGYHGLIYRRMLSADPLDHLFKRAYSAAWPTHGNGAAALFRRSRRDPPANTRPRRSRSARRTHTETADTRTKLRRPAESAVGGRPRAAGGSNTPSFHGRRGQRAGPSARRFGTVLRAGRRRPRRSSARGVAGRPRPAELAGPTRQARHGAAYASCVVTNTSGASNASSSGVANSSRQRAVGVMRQAVTVVGTIVLDESACPIRSARRSRRIAPWRAGRRAIARRSAARRYARRRTRAPAYSRARPCRRSGRASGTRQTVRACGTRAARRRRGNGKAARGSPRA